MDLVVDLEGTQQVLFLKSMEGRIAGVLQGHSPIRLKEGPEEGFEGEVAPERALKTRW